MIFMNLRCSAAQAVIQQPTLAMNLASMTHHELLNTC